MNQAPDPTPAPDDLEATMRSLAAARRTELGLSTDEVGELIGASTDTIEAFENGQGRVNFITSAHLSSTLRFTEPWYRGLHGAAASELDAHAAALGCWTAHAPLLAWARRLYLLDERLTYSATHVPPGRRDLDPAAIAAAVAQPVLGPVRAPRLEDPRRRPTTDQTYHAPGWRNLDYRVDGLILADLLRTHLGLPDAPANPVDVAAALGVSVATAPAAGPSGTKAILLRPAGTALIVANSNYHDVVVRHSLAHLVGHFVAGDTVAGSLIDTIEDEDDDSIYSCSGATSSTCHRADAFAGELLLPATWLRAWATDRAWAETDDADRSPGSGSLRMWRLHLLDVADDADVAPRLVLEAAVALGLVPGDRAEQLDAAFTRRSPFGGSGRNGGRDALISEDLALPPGDGATRMPAALRRRVLTGWEHGSVFTPPTELFEDAAFSAADAERVRATDAARHEALREWNDAQVAQLFASHDDATGDEAPA